MFFSDCISQGKGCRLAAHGASKQAAQAGEMSIGSSCSSRRKAVCCLSHPVVFTKLEEEAIQDISRRFAHLVLLKKQIGKAVSWQLAATQTSAKRSAAQTPWSSSPKLWNCQIYSFNFSAVFDEPASYHCLFFPHYGLTDQI